MVGLPVTGFDRLSSGTGQMSWRVLGLVRVMTADGPDITRSAAGRLMAEIALVPTAFRAVAWTAGAYRDSAIATCQAGSGTEHAELRVGPDGRLLEVTLNRWGNPDGEPYGRYPFGMTTEAEATFAGGQPGDEQAGGGVPACSSPVARTGGWRTGAVGST
jgi:Family of unknown function (DUF6544)